ncbi:hypothetical protein C6W88_18000 [Halomonas litopenaei]|uniref:DUF805 domain-containing protein n=2 Tax=Halomonas TaxID=2745 RepID=A0ABX5IS21_9GAMM|nr:DUF805 domain-containing protein [Halomonas litopenaei]PTL89725.1 hypothetical protein C6W89_16960 [Halomonas sp. SYSU XM8]PTL91952.1 hypothetical protein C6W88_18000 [Halomonas litopenaei]
MTAIKVSLPRYEPRQRNQNHRATNLSKHQLTIEVYFPRQHSPLFCEKEMHTTQNYSQNTITSTSSSRIGRLKFFYIIFTAFIIQLVLFSGILYSELTLPIPSPRATIISFSIGKILLSIASLAIILLVSRWRLNDKNLSPWWLVLHLLPVANIALFLFLLFSAGQKEENRYGPPPAKPSTFEQLYTCGLFIVALALGYEASTITLN